MQTVTLEAELREPVSRGKLNDLRKSGWMPAVLYGEASSSKKSSKGHPKSVLLKVNEKIFFKTIGAHQKSNAIIDLKWGKENANVLVKEIQRDSVTRKFLHVDFQRILMTEKLELMVPVHITGEAPGVKNSGGILEYITRELKIVCLPKDIPSAITVDVSLLEIGQGIHVKDLKEISGVQIQSDPALIIVNVVPPTIIEETPAAAVAAPTSTEPEVIKKGKKPEEGEAAAAAPTGAAPAGKAGEKAPAATPKAGSPAGGK